jgi:hypothetical protein
MDARERPNDSSVERRLAQELHELSAAIEMVAGGTADRMSLAGLRFGEQVLERLRDEAELRGVTLEPRWWQEDEGCDIVVRKAGRAP